MDHSHHHSSAEPPFWKSKIGIALIMLAVIGGMWPANITATSPKHCLT